MGPVGGGHAAAACLDKSAGLDGVTASHNSTNAMWLLDVPKAKNHLIRAVSA